MSDYEIRFLDKNDRVLTDYNFCRELLLERVRKYFDSIKVIQLVNRDSVDNNPNDLEKLIFDIFGIKVEVEIGERIIESDEDSFQVLYETRIDFVTPYTFNIIYDISAILWLTLSKEIFVPGTSILLPTTYDSYDDWYSRIYLYLRKKNLIYPEYNQLLGKNCNGPATLVYFLISTGIIHEDIIKEIHKTIGYRFDVMSVYKSIF